MRYFRLKAGTCQNSSGVAAAGAGVVVSKAEGALQFLSLLFQTLFGLHRRSENNSSSSRSAATTHDDHVAGEIAGSSVPVPRVQVCPCVTYLFYLLF